MGYIHSWTHVMDIPVPPAVLGQPVLASRYSPLPCHLASDAPLWF